MEITPKNTYIFVMVTGVTIKATLVSLHKLGYVVKEGDQAPYLLTYTGVIAVK